MRIAVTGRGGQLANAMLERAAGLPDVTLLALVRGAFDLTRPDAMIPELRKVRPDIVVNAAAYTAVDKAEAEPELAMAVNGAGAGAVAAAARALGLPIVQISTDYVFDGAKPGPYVETDPTGPLNAYGRSKLAGEQAAAAANPDHAILRTSWVYAAQGRNFLRTMLALAETRPALRIVADQRGAPGYAPDLADAVLAVCRNLLGDGQNPALRGVFHMTGAGEASWADFAQAIFAGSAARGGPASSVEPIATEQYPTPAARPLNSRLDCAKLAAAHGVILPDWREGLERCLDQVFAKA